MNVKNNWIAVIAIINAHPAKNLFIFFIIYLPGLEDEDGYTFDVAINIPEITI